MAVSQDLATALQPGDRVRVCLKKNSRIKTERTQDPSESGGTIPKTINPSVPRPIQHNCRNDNGKVLKATEEGGKKQEHVDNRFPTGSNRRQWSNRK